MLLGLGFVSCSTHSDYSTSSTPQQPTSQEVAINTAPLISTRTELDPDDMATTQWSSEDRIYLWAKGEGDSFELENEEFKLHFFSTVYSAATFTTTIDPMTEDEYLYFAVYPQPSSANGSQVSFTLPTQQSGLYDGDLDILTATPIYGEALTAEPADDLSLRFSHMTHAIRINIPDGRNLFGQEIKKLEVTFPNEVVGTLSFNAANIDPTTTLSDASKVVTLNFEQALDEGDQYAWLFIAPTYLDGEITFRGYNSEGYKSENISVDIDKDMVAGRITPLTLTVPEEATPTTLTLSIASNNLGEEIETITITAPTGAYFLNEVSSVSLPVNGDNEYSIKYYADEYGDLFRSGSLALKFVSENAIVSGDAVTLGQVVDQSTNLLSCSVPYLYSTDFSSISSSSNNETSTCSLPGMTDWTMGKRAQWWAGECIAVRNYSNTFGGPYDSVVCSPSFESFGLKEGKSVTLKVLFNSDWCKTTSSSMNLIVGRATGTDIDDTISASTSIQMSSVSTATSSSTFTAREVYITGCTTDYHINWKSNGSNGSSWAYDRVYIDNVIIQIYHE
ncbi:MAG: fimbrillin family protein [Rikenellaceae bacterium]